MSGSGAFELNERGKLAFEESGRLGKLVLGQTTGAVSAEPKSAWHFWAQEGSRVPGTPGLTGAGRGKTR